jgi:peptidoglycan/LPS O-acetylase OafA/YrhL
MLVTTLISITLLFFVLLIVRKFFGLKACAICTATLLTWAGLWIAYRLGYFTDGILLGLLIGESITGIYYFIKQRVAKSLSIFTLPFMLTALVLAYYCITWSGPIIVPLLILLALWVIAYVIFAYRHDPGKKMVADAVMNCCGDK